MSMIASSLNEALNQSDVTLVMAYLVLKIDVCLVSGLCQLYFYFLRFQGRMHIQKSTSTTNLWHQIRPKEARNTGS